LCVSSSFGHFEGNQLQLAREQEIIMESDQEENDFDENDEEEYFYESDDEDESVQANDEQTLFLSPDKVLHLLISLYIIFFLRMGIRHFISLAMK
jgi:hypothetical protein